MRRRGLTRVRSRTTVHVTQVRPRERGADATGGAYAYELVENELITVDDFRDFTFANAVRLWGTVHPAFFKSTVVEKQAADVLASA